MSDPEHKPSDALGAGREAGSQANGRDVLAGEPAAEPIGRRRVHPVDLSDVAKFQQVRPVAGEDVGDGGADLGEPDRFRALVIALGQGLVRGIQKRAT